jgi:hypothetical protein
LKILYVSRACYRESVLKQNCVKPYCHVQGLCVIYKTGSGFDLVTPYSHNLGTTGNTALLLIYTLYNSPLLTHKGSQSSLVVSWQRIYNNLAVTSNHT